MLNLLKGFLVGLVAIFVTLAVTSFANLVLLILGVELEDKYLVTIALGLWLFLAMLLAPFPDTVPRIVVRAVFFWIPVGAGWYFYQYHDFPYLLPLAVLFTSTAFGYSFWIRTSPENNPELVEAEMRRVQGRRR
jgi:hypothetical protein